MTGITTLSKFTDMNKIQIQYGSQFTKRVYEILQEFLID